MWRRYSWGPVGQIQFTCLQMAPRSTKWPVYSAVQSKESLCTSKSLDAHRCVPCAERDVRSWDTEPFCFFLLHRAVEHTVAPLGVAASHFSCLFPSPVRETHLRSLTGNPLGTEDELISKLNRLLLLEQRWTHDCQKIVFPPLLPSWEGFH